MFIVFASIIESSLQCIGIYAADVKSRRHFQDKNAGYELDLLLLYFGNLNSTLYGPNQGGYMLCAYALLLSKGSIAANDKEQRTFPIRIKNS